MRRGLGKTGPANVAQGPETWQQEAAARLAHHVRSSETGAMGEVEAHQRTRTVATLPTPGDRARVDDDERDREARRRARSEAAELLQRANWRWFGPRKDRETGEWKTGPRPGTCGRALGQSVAVNVAAIDDSGKALPPGAETTGAARRAQFNGVETCGNPNVCLKCGAKIRGRRAADTGRVIKAHLAGGGGAYFVTATMSHERAEAAGDVIDDAMMAWSTLLSAGGWRLLKNAVGVVGFIRTTEVTHSDANGFHPHHHIAILTAAPMGIDDIDGGQVEWFRQQLDRLWSTQVTKLDRHVHPDIGVTVVPIRDDNGIGAYVSKIELELVRSDLKTGRTSGSRSHWQIGIDAAGRGHPQDVALWHEVFEAMKGRRYMSTSNGFWRLYNVVDEKTDDEIAAEQLQAAPLVELDRHVYETAARAAAPLLTEVRSLAESGVTPALLASVLGRRLGQALELVDPGPGEVPIIRKTPTAGDTGNQRKDKQ
ncbi:MAG: hypothetical protein AAF962_23180 [Actinomycetota bacterium]